MRFQDLEKKSTGLFQIWNSDPGRYSPDRSHARGMWWTGQEQVPLQNKNFTLWETTPCAMPTPALAFWARGSVVRLYLLACRRWPPWRLASESLTDMTIGMATEVVRQHTYTVHGMGLGLGYHCSPRHGAAAAPRHHHRASRPHLSLRPVNMVVEQFSLAFH